MRNKKYLVITAIILLLVFLFSLTLAACQKNSPTDDGDGNTSGDNNDRPNRPDFPGDGGDGEDPDLPAYTYDTMAAFEYISQCAPEEYMSIVVSGGVEVKGKKYVLDGRINVSDSDIELAVKINEESGKVVYAIYIVDSKLFVQIADGSIYHISEINTTYLLSIIDKLPAELKSLLEGVLSDLNMSVDSLINLVFPMLFNSQYSTEGEGEDKVENFVINVTIQDFLGNLGILADTILSKLDLNIDLSFISDLVKAMPKIDGVADVSIKNELIESIGFRIVDKSEEASGSTIAGFTSSIEFSSTEADLQLPENLDEYKEFSLGNLNADFSLAIDTGDNGLDLGVLIDSFLGDKAIFGSGVLVLKAGVDYKLNAKVSLDSNLEGSTTDNNLISLTLTAGDKVFASVNYIDGTFYINIEDQIKVAVEFDLASQINSLVKTVTDAIDNLLGTQFKPDDGIASVSLNESGEAVISSDWVTVLNKIIGVAGFEQFISVSGDSVNLTVNQQLIDKIIELAGGSAFTFPYQIDAMLKLSSNGIDYFEVTMLDKAIVLKAENFLIGTTDLTKDSVLSAIGNKDDYGKDVLGIVNSLLKDFSATVKLDLSTINTTLDITKLINNILVAQDASFNLPITLDLSNYSGVFTVDFAIYQGDNSLDNKLKLEVITPDGDMLMSAYVYEGKTYVDLSNLGLMKFVLTNADLFQIVKDKLMPSQDNAAVALASSEIDIDNSTISATLKSEFILGIMRMFMFDAGIDVSVDINANMAGAIEAVLDAGFVSIGLDITSGKESDNPITIDNINKSEYGEYNALNADVLVDSILESQNLNIMIDFYNNSVDTAFNKETRILIRRSTAQKGGKEYLANGLEAPYRSLVLILYDNWNNLNDDNAILFGYIDFDNGQVRVKGTKLLFDAWVANGTAIDIPIDLDVKGLLTDALGSLFGEGSVSTGGGIIDIPEGVLPDKDETDEGSVTEGLTVDSILKGISLTMTASMDIKVDVDFHGALVSDLLDETVQGVFTDMDLSSLTGNTNLITLNYDNDTQDVFFNDLYNYIIYPLMEKELGSFLATIANWVNIDNTVHSIVNRFLPLPSFDTFDVSVSLTQGKLHDISAVASNTDSSYGFAANVYNRNAADVISWQGQETSVYYNRNTGIDPNDLFAKQAKKQTSGHSSTDFYQNISWSINNAAITDWRVLDSYADGDYTVVGKAFDKTIEVQLTIESLAIEKVEDIVVKALREVPDYITVVLSDGSKRTLYGQTINYTRGAYASQDAMKAVPANVMLGGKQYDFYIWLENETVMADTIVVNAYNYKDVFEKLQNSKLKVKVNDSFYSYMDVEYDFSQFDSMSREELIVGGDYTVNAIVGKCTDLEQQLVIDVRFTPFEVYGIEINGKNYVDTDIYDYLAGKAFPETVTVVGFDGEKYEAKASWDISNVILDKDGGQYIASLTLNKGEYNEWDIPSVVVNINDADLAGLVSDTLVIDTMYALYGGVTFDRLIPDKLDFYTAQGEIKTGVPVTIDTSEVVFGIEGGTYECNVVAGEGSYKYETTLRIVLNDATFSLIQDEISFTYDEYVASGGDVFADKMEIKLGSAIVKADVSWFTDDVVFTTPGKYTAYVIIDEGGDYEQRCAITVNVLADEEV